MQWSIAEHKGVGRATLLEPSLPKAVVQNHIPVIVNPRTLNFPSCRRITLTCPTVIPGASCRQMAVLEIIIGKVHVQQLTEDMTYSDAAKTVWKLENDRSCDWRLGRCADAVCVSVPTLKATAIYFWLLTGRKVDVSHLHFVQIVLTLQCLTTLKTLKPPTLSHKMPKRSPQLYAYISICMYVYIQLYNPQPPWSLPAESALRGRSASSTATPAWPRRSPRCWKSVFMGFRLGVSQSVQVNVQYILLVPKYLL